MPQCPFCNSEVSQSAKFCAGCGKEIPQSNSFCLSCGTEIIAGKNFCHKCGAEVKGKIEEKPLDKEGETGKSAIPLEQQCPACYEPVTSGKKFCAFCGYELSKIITGEVPLEEICPECDSKIPSGEKNCPNCEEKSVIVKTGEEIKPSEEQVANHAISSSEDITCAVTVEVPMEKQCPACYEPVISGKKFCAFCGYELSKNITEEVPLEKICPECDGEIPLGEKNCPNCEEKTVIVKNGEEIKPSEEQFTNQVISSSEDIICAVTVEVPREKQCPACYEPVISGKKFCAFCGYELSKNITEEVPSLEKICPECDCKIPFGEKNCPNCEEKAVIVKTEEEIKPSEEQVTNQVISSSEDITCTVEKEELKPEIEEVHLQTSHSVFKVIPAAPCAVEKQEISLEVIEKKKENILTEDVNSTEKQGKPSDREISWKHIFIFFIVVLLVSLFGIIFHNAGRRTAEFSGTAERTPLLTVTASPVTDLTEVSLPTRVSTTVADLTATPEVQIIKPSPTTEVKVANPVPTTVPSPLPTIVPTQASVPTSIPTRAAGNRKPVVNVVSKPYATPVPTEIDYYKVHRTYCDNTINNKIAPLYNEGKYQEALVECNKLIYLDKNYYMNYIWMASCYLAQKDTVDAKYYIDMAYKLEYTETRASYEQSKSKKLYDIYHSLGGQD